MSTVEQEVISSFTKYLSNIIKYLNKYYKEHSLSLETLSNFLHNLFLTKHKKISKNFFGFRNH